MDLRIGIVNGQGNGGTKTAVSMGGVGQQHNASSGEERDGAAVRVCQDGERRGRHQCSCLAAHSQRPTRNVHQG